MADELIMQVRWPVSDLEEKARKKYGLTEKLSDFRLEGDAVVLYFMRDGSRAEAPQPAVPALMPSRKKDGSGPQPPEIKRKRRKAKRNRMKTRGWEVVAKITTSRGQTATIYKPFVDALKEKRSTAEQRAAVAHILRSNGNRPEESSIEYFLRNTLEYLAQQKD